MRSWQKILQDGIFRPDVVFAMDDSGLTAYDLPANLDEIRSMTRRQWTKLVNDKVEVKNTQRLLSECHKVVDGVEVPKSKTAHIIDELKKDTYRRKTQEEIMRGTKNEAKMLIIARFHMLECGRNFKGSMHEKCRTCDVTDDENHRINYCAKFSQVNNCNKQEKADYNDIFSHDALTIRNIASVIDRIWNVKTAHGTMRI